MLADLKFAFRRLMKSPGYSLLAVFILALGIGACTAVFSIVNAVLLRPLPYPDSDRLVFLHEKMTAFDSGSVSYPNFTDWREGQHGFTDLSLFRRENLNFAVAGTTTRNRSAWSRCGWPDTSSRFSVCPYSWEDLSAPMRTRPEVPRPRCSPIACGAARSMRRPTPLVAFLAAWIPACRALRVDPMVALRAN